MKLSEYLEWRVMAQGPRSLTKAEAELAKVPFPLVPGWPAMCADNELSPRTVAEMKVAFYARMLALAKSDVELIVKVAADARPALVTKRMPIVVAYADKEEARALGARWDNDARTWYVPMGQPLERFAKWLPKDELAKPAPERVDSYVGKTVVGSGYIELQHDCNPFEECPVCRPILDASGWNKRRQELSSVIAGLS